MVFWAFSFVWFKMANEHFRPIAIVFLRLVFAVVMLSAFLAFTKQFVKIRKSDYKLFFLLAFFEPFIYFLGESYGLTHVSATVCSVLISTIPVFAAIAARVIFNDKLSLLNYSGILLSFLGVVVFVVNKNGTFAYSPQGIALIFLAVFAAVGYNLTLSKLVNNYNPVYIVNVQNIIGAVLFIPMFMAMEVKPLMAIDITFKMLLPVLLLALFASCGAFILFAFAVRHLGLLRANVFSNCIPIFTAIFAFMLLGDMLTVQNFIGMFIVIAGLFMSQHKGKTI
jgi:drug/metabolite transporter (DMT)-like permease